MANISKLELVKILSDNGEVIVKKGFLGMGGKVVKADSGAVLRPFVREYVPVEGEKVYRMIQQDSDHIVASLRDSKPVCTDLGNMRLEGLLAEDGSVLLLRLFKYVDFTCQPYSDLKVFEGGVARHIAESF